MSRPGSVTHYSYSEPLPHNGGTDAISVYRGQILISASAPGTSGAAAPDAKYPAVYLVTLNQWTKVAHVSPLYYDEAPALQANGAKAGQAVDLAPTDSDSNEVKSCCSRAICDASGCTHTRTRPRSPHRRCTCIHRAPVGSHATVTAVNPAARAAATARSSASPSRCALTRAVLRHSTRTS
jgi:hypothetical protein